MLVLMALAAELGLQTMTASAPPRAPNALYSLVQRYDRAVCRHESLVIDPLLARWRREPGYFPISLVANKLVAQECAGVAGDCECLHRVAVRYEGSMALRTLPMTNASGEPSAQAIAGDLREAIAVWRELRGGPLSWDDPRPEKETWLERIADTGVGYFAPFQDDKIAALLAVEAYADRGRRVDRVSPCAGEVITQAELMYVALEATGGNVTQAMGGLSGVLHDGIYGEKEDGRKIANCVNGLSRKHHKDYYRYAGLYVGLQERAAFRAGGSAASKGEIGSYAVVKSVLDLDPATLIHTVEAKLPEFRAGLEAGDTLRKNKP